jgi:hypothetical protein
MTELEEQNVKNRSGEENLLVVDGESYPVVKMEDGRIIPQRCAFQTLGKTIVDFKKSPTLQRLYKKVQPSLVGSEENRLEAISQAVDEALPIRDDDAVNNFARQQTGRWKKPISLETFLRERTGSCEQALLAMAALIWQAKSEGFLDGLPHQGVLMGDRGSHVWLRYLSSGKEIVADPMQKYCGNTEGHKAIEFMTLIEMMDEVE